LKAKFISQAGQAERWQQIEMKEQKPIICYEGDLDEACLVGTRDELKAFANQILESLSEDGKSVEYDDIKAKYISGNLTEFMTEIVLEGIVILENTNHKQGLVNYIRQLNEDSSKD
jgi:hypothetical protein